MIGPLNAFCADERAATAIEYALIAGFLVFGMVAALTLFADETNRIYDYVSTEVINAVQQNGT